MLKNVKYLLTTNNIKDMPQDNISEYVIVGKSNVGKSTFINFLTNNKKMAHTSSKPGKTRAISLFDVDNKFRLVDIPGYGYARVSKEQKLAFSKMLEMYFSKRKNIAKIILLIDCRRGITSDDKDMIDYLVNKNFKFVIIGTKEDKLNQSEKFKFFKNIDSELGIKPITYSYLRKNDFLKIKDIFL